MSNSTDLRGRAPLRGAFHAAFPALLIVLLVFAPSCGNDSSPTSMQPIVTGVAGDKLPIDPQTDARRLLSRSVAAGPDRVTVLASSGPENDRAYAFQVTDPSFPDIARGTILLGEGFGPAQEVMRAQRSGDFVVVRTREVDYSPVSQGGEINFHVPLDGNGGQNDVVRWGPWELVNPNNGQRVPFKDGALPADFPLDEFFDGFGVCVSGGPASACGNFDVTVVEGYLKAAGGVDFRVLSTYPEATFVGASITAWEEIDAKLILEIDGGGSIQVEACVVGFCGEKAQPELVRRFEAGNIAGEIKLGIVVGVRAGVDGVIVRPGFELNDLDMSFTVGYNDGLYFDFDAPEPAFEPSFEVVSLGEGFLRLYVGPKLAASIDILGGWASVGAEIGAYAYIEQTVDLDPLIADCSLFHTGTEAGTEIKAKAYGKLAGAELKASWLRPGPNAELFDWWSTGNLTVQTNTSGVDPDYNGYDVTAARTDVENAPEWDDILDQHLGLNDMVMWNGGGFCHRFADWLPLIGGIRDCNLASTYHTVSISDVMWNCAVAQAENANVCVEPFTTTKQSFDVTCISVFQALCLTVDEYRKAGMIRNRGLANSLKVKFLGAEAARDREQPDVAENKLNAATHELAAQRGKGLHPDVTSVLTERVQTVVDHYLYPSVTEEPLSLGDKRTVDR